jgi:hypothetical protein
LIIAKVAEFAAYKARLEAVGYVILDNRLRHGSKSWQGNHFDLSAFPE